MKTSGTTDFAERFGSMPGHPQAIGAPVLSTDAERTP